MPLSVIKTATKQFNGIASKDKKKPRFPTWMFRFTCSTPEQIALPLAQQRDILQAFRCLESLLFRGASYHWRLRESLVTNRLIGWQCTSGQSQRAKSLVCLPRPRSTPAGPPSIAQLSFFFFLSLSFLSFFLPLCLRPSHGSNLSEFSEICHFSWSNTVGTSCGLYLWLAYILALLFAGFLTTFLSRSAINNHAGQLH